MHAMVEIVDLCERHGISCEARCRTSLSVACQIAKVMDAVSEQTLLLEKTQLIQQRPSLKKKGHFWQIAFFKTHSLLMEST